MLKAGLARYRATKGIRQEYEIFCVCMAPMLIKNAACVAFPGVKLAAQTLQVSPHLGLDAYRMVSDGAALGTVIDGGI